MARTGKTAQEFIKDSFSPNVALLCSSRVENVVSKNNLTLAELLQPFTTVECEGQLRDPGGSSCIIKNMKLIIRDVNWKPLQPTEARRQLNNAVLHNYSDKTVAMEFEGKTIDIPQLSHWFDAWRETYLEVQFPSDHEFTKHFLSCIIVGVAHDENVIDSFNTLNQQYAQLQNVTPPKLPKWFNNGILKSYLLLHDASIISREKAEVTFETLKQTFGASNCFILTINSKSASDTILTDYWAPYIKRTDTNNEMTSSMNQPSTPAEPQTIIVPSNMNIEETPGLSASVQADSSHPLTSPDNDVYDNANSLQTHSFSGSAESVSVASRGLDTSLEIHGSSLNMIDIDDIKKFLQDYALKTMLPHIEKLISQLAEVVSNRKGVSRSLLSATKRWFGTGKAANTTATSTVIYTSECPEVQLRRLGDLWFMCGQWQRAFDAYHTAKREFYADSAWLFYAGALEMAAISAFMAGDANRKTHGYMEESIVTYLNTCRMVQYAVRATLLSVLCLGSAGLHGEAAKQLIRMTSEDSDLRSAMLLEQASLCFLSGPGSKAMCRKYAFHMVLAGHRFSKAGQKKHAYRCYKQAYQVYGETGWRLATDHVQFALGRLASALRNGREALSWLSAPLHAAPAPARQNQLQQAAFLREYMLAHQQWIETCEENKDRRWLPPLPLPTAERRGTSVVCAGPAPLSAAGRCAASSLAGGVGGAATDPGWARLEQMLLQVAQGSVPMLFKPTVDLYNDTTDCDPIVPVGEPVQISITLCNPLKIALILKEVELLWQFVSSPTADAEAETFINEPAVASGSTVESNAICGQKIKSTLIEGDSKKVLTFTLTPLRVGKLSIRGVAYKLVNGGESGNENGSGVSISGKLDLECGQRSTDRRLHITVIPEAPCLQMTFSETSPEILSGEMRSLDVEFTNVGPVGLRGLHVAVSHPDCVSVAAGDDDRRLLYDLKYSAPDTHVDERTARAQRWRAQCERHVRAVGAGARRAALLLRAHRAAPVVRLLAYYETGLRERPYRLLRHEFHWQVAEAVEVSVTPRRNLSNKSGEAFENMSLAVEVKNISSDKHEATVELLEASLFSRQWQLTHLVTTGSKCTPLLQRERLHLVLKAKRILHDLPDKQVNHSLVKISDTDYTALVANAPPYTKFIMDGAPVFQENNDNLPPLTNKRGDLIESMFVLRWKVNDKSSGTTVIGQQSLWLECFSKAQDVISKTDTTLQIEDCDARPERGEARDPRAGRRPDAVLLALQHAPLVTHDFRRRRLCSVPVTVNIVNCYRAPVNVFIDMTKQNKTEYSGELGWCGALSAAGGAGEGVGVRVSLERLESRRVRVRAVCAAPGTYVVGAGLAVTAAPAPDLAVTTLSDNTSLLVVQQA